MKLQIFTLFTNYKKKTVSGPDFTLENSLFGVVKITKNVDTSKYNYSGYGNIFDAKSSFSFGNSLKAKELIIFGCDMSFSSHSNNRANKIYVLGKDFIQGINGTTIFAEKMYKTDFTEQDKKFVLSLNYNGGNSYLFVKGVEQLKFKTKNSKIPLCLGSLSDYLSQTNQTETGLYGNVFDFPVDYLPISVGNIYHIHRNGIV